MIKLSLKVIKHFKRLTISKLLLIFAITLSLASINTILNSDLATDQLQRNKLFGSWAYSNLGHLESFNEENGIVGSIGIIKVDNEEILGNFDRNMFELSNIELIEGRFPKNESEIVVAYHLDKGSVSDVIDIEVDNLVMEFTIVGIIPDYSMYWNRHEQVKYPNLITTNHDTDRTVDYYLPNDIDKRLDEAYLRNSNSYVNLDMNNIDGLENYINEITRVKVQTKSITVIAMVASSVVLFYLFYSNRGFHLNRIKLLSRLGMNAKQGFVYTLTQSLFYSLSSIILSILSILILAIVYGLNSNLAFAINVPFAFKVSIVYIPLLIFTLSMVCNSNIFSSIKLTTGKLETALQTFLLLLIFFALAMITLKISFYDIPDYKNAQISNQGLHSYGGSKMILLSDKDTQELMGINGLEESEIRNMFIGELEYKDDKMQTPMSFGDRTEIDDTFIYYSGDYLEMDLEVGSELIVNDSYRFIYQGIIDGQDFEGFIVSDSYQGQADNPFNIYTNWRISFDDEYSYTDIEKEIYRIVGGEYFHNGRVSHQNLIEKYETELIKSIVTLLIIVIASGGILSGNYIFTLKKRQTKDGLKIILGEMKGDILVSDLKKLGVLSLVSLVLSTVASFFLISKSYYIKRLENLAPDPITGILESIGDYRAGLLSNAPRNSRILIYLLLAVIINLIIYSVVFYFLRNKPVLELLNERDE